VVDNLPGLVRQVEKKKNIFKRNKSEYHIKINMPQFVDDIFFFKK